MPQHKKNRQFQPDGDMWAKQFASPSSRNRGKREWWHSAWVRINALYPAAAELARKRRVFHIWNGQPHFYEIPVYMQWSHGWYECLVEAHQNESLTHGRKAR